MSSLHVPEERAQSFPVNVDLDETVEARVVDPDGRELRVVTRVHDPVIAATRIDRNAPLLQYLRRVFLERSVLKELPLGTGVARVFAAALESCLESLAARRRDVSRVLFLTHYYPPEIGAPQARISELAVRLRNLGHDVTVLTGMPHYPDGVVPAAYRGRAFVREVVDGVPVLRTWVYATRNTGFARRLLDHASFTTTALYGMPFAGRCDVVVTECPPLFTGLARVAISRVRGAKHVFHAADLWPESAIALGALRSPQLATAAHRPASFIYDRSEMITVSAQGQRDRLLDRGVAAERIRFLPNGVDVERFQPGGRDPEFRRTHGLDGKFVVLYHGTPTVGRSREDAPRVEYGIEPVRRAGISCSC